MAGKGIPFTVVEFVHPSVPTPEPAAIYINNGGRESVEPVQQKHVENLARDIGQAYLLELVRTGATSAKIPYKVQFTPATSLSGGPPVDNALFVDVKSEAQRSFRLIPPSQYLSDAKSSGPVPPMPLSDMKSTAITNTAGEDGETTLADNRSNKTTEETVEQEDSPPKRKLRRLRRRTPSPPPPPSPELTGSRPFHHHDVWPRPPCSNPNALSRRGAFYYKSHPKLWWDGTWGEMPSESAHVTMEDILPPWAGGHPDPSVESDATSASGSISASSKGKEKCLDSNLDSDGATQGLDSEDRPVQHAPSTESHSAGSWNGLTKTLRSMAASVKALAAPNEASTSRDGAMAPSGSSENSRSKGKKRGREDEDEGEGKKGEVLYDSNDESTFWNLRKKVKRNAKK
jgi:hypothetical protein